MKRCEQMLVAIGLSRNPLRTHAKGLITLLYSQYERVRINVGFGETKVEIRD